MSESRKSVWTRPWSGRAKALAWFLPLFGVTFLAIWYIEYGTAPNARGLGPTQTALVIALAVSALACALLLFVRWLCSWKNFRRFLFGAACLATLVALAYAQENWRGKYLWQKHRRQWEAEGEKFDIMALAPPQVPDEKNFAMTPLLKPMLDYSEGPTGVVWHDTNGIARSEKISAEIVPHGATNGHLVLGSVEKGTFADLDACAAFYRGNTNYPQADPSAAPAETILLALDKFAPELKELREAAVARPYCRFPIHYDYQPCWAILLPHLARLNALTTLVHARATAELESGKTIPAFEDLKLGLRFSDSISNEPILIDHLVRIATLGSDLQTLREGLVRHAWTEAQLAEFESYFGSLNLLAEYKLTMRGERALAVGGLDYLRRQWSPDDPMRFIDDLDNNQSGSVSLGAFGLAPSGWLYQNMLTISRIHQQFLLCVVDERDDRVFPALAEREESVAENLPAGPYTIFARLLLPALGKAIQKSARMQTYVDAARVACAIERYRLATGSLPETLEALCPRFLDSVRKDVIDGKSLRYRPDSGGYLLYSVGWNQTDDGGQLAWVGEEEWEKKRSHVDLTRGDWVWQIPAQ